MMASTHGRMPTAMTDPVVPVLSDEPYVVGPHEHEFERGKHMTEAFGVDGRRLACAICGIYKPEPLRTSFGKAVYEEPVWRDMRTVDEVLALVTIDVVFGTDEMGPEETQTAHVIRMAKKQGAEEYRKALSILAANPSLVTSPA